MNRPYSADHDRFIELGKKGRVVITPMPGWSTHCETNYLSPCIDWEQVVKDTTPESVKV